MHQQAKYALDDDEIDPALRETKMDPWERAYHEANARRFEIARRVGFLAGSIKNIADYLEAHGDPNIAAEILRDALARCEDKPNG